MHLPGEQVNQPGITWIRGQIQVNHLHEANTARQGLAFRGQLTNALS